MEEARGVFRISGPVRFPLGQAIEDEGKTSEEGSASGGQAGRIERRRRVHSKAATAANPPYSIHSHHVCSACSL
jgi:hypothetical protein